MRGWFQKKHVFMGGAVRGGRVAGGGARWPTRRAGPSQMIFAECGGLRIPFGRRLRKVRPLALAFFVRGVCRSHAGAGTTSLRLGLKGCAAEDPIPTRLSTTWTRVKIVRPKLMIIPPGSFFRGRLLVRDLTANH